MYYIVSLEQEGRGERKVVFFYYYFVQASLLKEGAGVIKNRTQGVF